MYRGFVKLWRRIDENPIATKPAYLSVFLWLTRHANNKPRKMIWNNKAVEIKRGQLITSAAKIGEGTGVPRGTVEHILDYLKAEELIEEVTNYRFRLITVKNYGKYQDHEEVSGEQLTSNLRATEEQLDTNKNVKNVKNEKTLSNDKGTRSPRLAKQKSSKSPDGYYLEPDEDPTTMNQDVDRSFPRKRLYGNEKINWLLDYYEFKTSSKLAEGERWARIFAKHLMTKVGAGKTREMIEWVSEPDCWWFGKITGLKMLYHKRETILQRMETEVQEVTNSTEEQLKRLAGN